MKRSERLQAGLILFVVLTGQIIVLWRYDGFWWLSLTLVPFIFVSIILFLSASLKASRILNMFRYLVILIGPFATLGCLLILCLTPRRDIAENYRAFLAAEAVFSPSEKLDLGSKQISWQEEASVTPYIDIMEGNNSPLKRNTINKVIQHPGASSRNILNIGLNDNDSEIRFYAASALILLNDSFIKEFRDISDKIKNDPTNALFHFELAASYDRYCTWDLAEQEDLPGYYEKIKHAYSTSLAYDPRNLNAIIGLSRVLLKQENHDKASQIINKGLDQYPDSAILKLQHLKLLHKQGNYKELREAARLFINKFPNISLEIQEAVAFWGEDKKSGKNYEYNFS